MTYTRWSCLILMLFCFASINSEMCIQEYKEKINLKQKDTNLPSCEEDGTYSPVQCVQTGQTEQCICVDSQGNQLTKGYTDKKPMNCNCVIDRFHNEDNKSDCDEFTGNYNPVQCASEDDCFCVDEKGNREERSSQNQETGMCGIE